MISKKLVLFLLAILLIQQAASNFKSSSHLNRQTTNSKRLDRQRTLSFVSNFDNPGQNNSEDGINNQQGQKINFSQISEEQYHFNQQFLKEKKGKIMQLLKTHKPEFSTISNCQIYNNSESCALCRSSYVLSRDSSQCVQGRINNCVEYLSENSCGKCKSGYVLTDMMQKCRSVNDYFDDGFDDEDSIDNNVSGINWNRNNYIPTSNRIPDGEYDFIMDIFGIDDYLLDGTDSDGECGQQEIPDYFSEDQQQQQDSDGEAVYYTMPEQQYENGEIVLGGGSESDGEEPQIVFLQSQALKKQNKITAFMSLFDNKY